MPMSEVLLMNARAEKPAPWLAADADVSSLNRIAGRISSSLPIDAVLLDVVEVMSALTCCDACSIYLLDNDEFVLRASNDSGSRRVNHLALNRGQQSAGWLMGQREPVSGSRRAFSDTRPAHFSELPEEGYEAFLTVPIVSGGRLFGVINLQNRNPYQYNPREISLAMTLGFMVGAKVNCARLEAENALLDARLRSRKLVERAKGILQREMKISEDAAYRAMRQESQHMRKSMREIAEAVLLTDNLRKCVP